MRARSTTTTVALDKVGLPRSALITLALIRGVSTSLPLI